MKRSKINCEQDAITWVTNNLLILIKPSRKSKYEVVKTFTSHNAFNQVADGLGKEVWKLLNHKPMKDKTLNIIRIILWVVWGLLVLYVFISAFNQ